MKSDNDLISASLGQSQLRFVELLYSAQMGRVIRMELLATSGWLLGRLTRLRRYPPYISVSHSCRRLASFPRSQELEAPHE